MQMNLRDPFTEWMTFQMSLATDSPVHSSSSDDFAAFLDTELASNPDTSSNQEDEDEDEDEDDIERYQCFHLLGPKVS